MRLRNALLAAVGLLAVGVAPGHAQSAGSGKDPVIAHLQKLGGTVQPGPDYPLGEITGVDLHMTRAGDKDLGCCGSSRGCGC